MQEYINIIEDLNRKIEARDWRNANCSIEFKANHSWIKLSAKHPISDSWEDRLSEIIRFDNEQAKFDFARVEADRIIGNLVTGKDAALDQYRKALAKALAKALELVPTEIDDTAVRDAFNHVSELLLPKE